ncbi:PREDICTED: BAG family molecular chaperone regulator 3-like [Fragaria vesca subsp. vesca]|uniref:BAG family molecular chaperone regulator 3-like n=1 Tax=Fragaria vesca subsp. vesca TaxID=101020 RepID=UPI0002C32AC6|nr:PREDICTED: BAG family molecular chaperone regulator 3-like [Fragaria vesca subsp. vesca]
MMKRRSLATPYGRDMPSSTTKDEEVEWEMRPGGMLVQKRVDKSSDVVPAPNLRLRIAFGALRYEISASSQSTFGELKKVLTAETGLQPGDQRLIFRGKERENGEYLDMCGVKDRSKVMLIEDPGSIERRANQMRRNAKIQTAHRAISDVCMEVDKLEEQVTAIEKSISNGVKVAEVQITTLIEMLMRLAIKLDNVSAEGDASAQKSLQSKRVQKCVETLDVMKISNAEVKPVVVTTKWETFDPPPTTAKWEFFD